VVDDSSLDGLTDLELAFHLSSKLEEDLRKPMQSRLQKAQTCAEFADRLDELCRLYNFDQGQRREAWSAFRGSVHTALLFDEEGSELPRGPADRDLEFIIKRTQDLRSRDQYTCRLWAWLKSARVFHLDPDLFKELLRGASAWLQASLLELGGVELHDDQMTIMDQIIEWGTDKVLDDDQVQSHQKRVLDASKGVPFPEQLPFDSVFLGFGGGMRLSSAQGAIRLVNLSHELGPNEEIEIEDIQVLGYLINHSGSIVEFLRYKTIPEGSDVAGGEESLSAMVVYDEDEWASAAVQCLLPWALSGVIGIINEHRTLILEAPSRGAEVRRLTTGLKKKLRIHKMKPPAFYQVNLRSDVYIEHFKRPRGPDTGQVIRSYGHRWDVRGHERCRIKRGPRPMPAETRERLLSRGYQVFESELPDDEAYHKMTVRGHLPKKQGEWVAVLSYWVNPHIRGPEEAPYVPSVHTIRGLEPLESTLG
jgi:hypothetical protein